MFKTSLRILTISLLFLCSADGYSQKKTKNGAIIQVGISRIDITPEWPILLAGYGERKAESEGVLQPLFAKAIAFGSDADKPSILVTVDLIGIQWYMTRRLADRLSEKIGIDPSQVVICASHTHCGPEIGNLLNHFGRQLPPEEIGRINKYLEQLQTKLEQVALAAWKDRQPSRIAWGIGKAGFAKNRRWPAIKDPANASTPAPGPVDHSLPMMRVTDLSGKLRAVMVNYACHGTTLTGETNNIHGDWIGEAQRLNTVFLII